MYRKKRKKQAEKDFHVGRRQLAIAMDMAQLSHWEYDVETDMFTFDDHFYALYGTTAGHESGLHMSARVYTERFFYPEDSGIVAAEIGKAVASTNPDYSGHVEHRIIRADGQERFVSVRYRIMKDSTGRTIRLYGAFQDITERKKVEEALKERDKTLQAFFEAVHESVALIDTEGTVILSNKVGAQRLGKTVPEFVGTCIYDHFPPDVARYRKEQYDKVVDTGEAVYFQDSRSGRSFEQHCYPVFDKAGKVSGATIFACEITDRKRDEEALRKSEQVLYAERDKLRTISENAPFGMALIDRNGTFTYLNPTFREMFGYDLIEIPDGRTWFRKAYPEEVYRHSVISSWVNDFSDLKPGESKKRTFTVTCKNGKQKTVSFIPLRLYSGDYLVTFEDVTELRHLEAQLRQSQKMEAIGTLAGGVAHDFNNILTTIIGYCSILQMDIDDKNPRKQYLDQILASSQKAANLTRSLLAFSRKQVIELKPHSLNTILKGMEKLLGRLLTEDIEFDIILADPDVSIMADMTQIDQVLMNLAANARDAMPKGGKLIIRAENIVLDSKFIQANGYGEPGCYVLISISDTGCGMDEITRDKIFEPFFTTKEVGRGTGLGLSIVYGIVKQHNGYIDVYSEPYKGTVFKIYFPALEVQVEELRQAQVNIQGGKETILVAEDNNALRILTKEVLMRKGYTVIEATDGEDAVRKFMEQSDTIDLLLLDVVMPRMNGKEAHEEMRTMRPDIKTLFTSGYTGDVVVNKGICDNVVNFIYKPLSPNELLLKVREVLDR